MNFIDIVTNYIGHLKENFSSTDNFADATHQYTTGELLQNMFLHFGIDDTDKEYEYDRSFFILKMNELGFNYKMLPGDIEIKWLFVEKR